MAPFPMAAGVVVMLLVTLGLLVATDPVLALIGGVIFPLIAVLNVVYSRRLAPLMIQAQQLRAEVSGLAHESFDGALTVKVLGRAEQETERFAERARELRGALIRVGRLRGLFDPALEALPNLSRAGRTAPRRTSRVFRRPGRGRSRTRRLPFHALGVSGACHRLAAG